MIAPHSQPRSSAADGALRVVHTVHSLDRRGGGLTRVVPLLADHLLDQGCEVSIVHLRTPGQSVAPSRAPAAAARPLRVGQRNLWSREFSGLVAGALGSHGRRALHDNGLWGCTNVIAARVAYRTGVPLIISPHGMLEPWALRHRAGRKRLAMLGYQRAILESAVMFVVSAATEAAAVRAAGLRQPIAIVPAGIETGDTIAAHAPVAPLRRLLFLSRIHPIKGLAALIDAWQQVGAIGWEVIVAGPDEDGHRAELERLLLRRQLQHVFKFAGEVDDARKTQLFAAADLFVLPSHSENFGLVVGEALAHGLPVLTTRGTPWGILESIGAGWWVEPGVAGLAAGLRAALATTAARRQQMGLIGRDYVRNQLSWQRAARLTLEAYRWRLNLDSSVPDHVQLD